MYYQSQCDRHHEDTQNGYESLYRTKISKESSVKACTPFDSCHSLLEAAIEQECENHCRYDEEKTQICAYSIHPLKKHMGDLITATCMNSTTGIIQMNLMQFGQITLHFYQSGI